MSPDLAGFLAAYAVIFNGDPVAGTWSIGGPPPADPVSGILLGQAQGISYSHNNYEGDVSMSRPDAYLNVRSIHFWLTSDANVCVERRCFQPRHEAIHQRLRCHRQPRPIHPRSMGSELR